MKPKLSSAGLGMLAGFALITLDLGAAAPARHPAVGQKFTPQDVDWQHPVYQCSFDSTEALLEWRLEGGKEMRVTAGRLVLESPPGAKTANDNFGHLVCWLNREVPGNFLLEFSFRPLNRRQGLAIVFFNARGTEGRSVFDPALAPRNGMFPQYHSGDIDNYHISYWAGDRGTAHVRKNRGFRLVSLGEDRVVDAPAERFQIIRIYKRDGTIRLMVDDVLSVAYDDDGRTLGPVWTHPGWIGLRQMGHTIRAEYDHVTVWPLAPLPAQRDSL